MTPDPDDLRTITLKQAHSGKVSYSEAVVLHETGRTRIVLVPFYIPRSQGTELSIKLISYRKAEPPMSWVAVEEKSLSLPEAASRQLLRGLRDHLQVADEGADGSYLLVKVAEGTADIGSHNPRAVAGALAKVLGSEEIVKHLAGTELSDQFVSAFRGAIRLSEMRNAVAQLREQLDRGETSEGEYQRWCEAHTWAFGNAYVMRDDVRNISIGDQLDLLLPTVISGYRDIVELKRPDMTVLNRDEAHRNYYFSSEVSKAIGQVHRYLDVLHEVAANGLRDNPKIVAYHPRATVVIGRSNDWDSEKLKSLHGLNRRLNGLTIMTYDQLLAMGERLVEMLGAAPNTSMEAEPVSWEDEDAPF